MVRFRKCVSRMSNRIHSSLSYPPHTHTYINTHTHAPAPASAWSPGRSAPAASAARRGRALVDAAQAVPLLRACVCVPSVLSVCMDMMILLTHPHRGPGSVASKKRRVSSGAAMSRKKRWSAEKSHDLAAEVYVAIASSSPRLDVMRPGVRGCGNGPIDMKTYNIGIRLSVPPVSHHAT